MLDPFTQANEFTDFYGNSCQRLVAPSGIFFVKTDAHVVVADSVIANPAGHFIEVQNLPDSTLIYLLPSRYCDSEYFRDLAAEITTGFPLGYQQVAAIEQWIRLVIRYELNGSDAPVSASEVNSRQWGVCRDLAHLGIALCRALSIPARLAVGFLHGLEPMDMHAWFEAYVDDRWNLFDPSQESGDGNKYVVLGYGRDAADVAIYNQFGPPVYPLEKTIAVRCQKQSEEGVNHSA